MRVCVCEGKGRLLYFKDRLHVGRQPNPPCSHYLMLISRPSVEWSAGEAFLRYIAGLIGRTMNGILVVATKRNWVLKSRSVGRESTSYKAKQSMKQDDTEYTVRQTNKNCIIAAAAKKQASCRLCRLHRHLFIYIY